MIPEYEKGRVAELPQVRTAEHYYRTAMQQWRGIMRQSELEHNVDHNFTTLRLATSDRLPEIVPYEIHKDRVVRIEPSVGQRLRRIPGQLFGRVTEDIEFVQRGMTFSYLPMRQELYVTDVQTGVPTPDEFHPGSEGFSIDNVRAALHVLQKQADPAGNDPMYLQRYYSVRIVSTNDPQEILFDGIAMGRIAHVIKALIDIQGSKMQAEFVDEYVRYFDDLYRTDGELAHTAEASSGSVRNRLRTLSRAVYESRPNLLQVGRILHIPYTEGDMHFYFRTEDGELWSATPPRSLKSREAAGDFSRQLRESRGPGIVLYRYADKIVEELLRDKPIDKVLGKLKDLRKR